MRTHVLAVPFVFAAASFTLATDSDAAISSRGYVTGNYAIQIDGQPGGFVSSVAGGGLTATTIVERSGGPGQYPKKRVGSPGFDDIVVTVGSPDKPLSDWIKTSVNTAQPTRKDGAIIAADVNFKEVSRTSWTRGYLSEVTFPELDVTDGKKRWELELTITPDTSRYSATPGGAVQTSAASAKSRQGPTIHDFRLAIPGLNLTRVSQIDEISVRFRSVSSSVPADQLRSFEKTSGTVDISNLVFTMPETEAAQLYNWYQSFVVKSGGADKEKKTATIEMLAPDMKVVSKITLSGVGIIKVGPPSTPAKPGETARKVRAEAFVESVQLDMP